MNTRALKSGTIQYKDTVGNSQIYDLVDSVPSFFINDILFTFPEDWDDSDNLSEAELYDECIAYFEVVAPEFTYEETEYHEPPMKVFDDFDNDGVN